MGAFVRVHRRGMSVACAALLAVALAGRCATRADSRRDVADPRTTAPRTAAGRAALAAQLARLARARPRNLDWRIGRVPSVRLEGEVVMDGEPVAGAEVRVAVAPGSIEAPAAVTDERGRFDLGYQDPLEIHVVARQGDQRGVRAIDLADWVSRSEAWVTIALEQCERWVTGRLVDRAGRPLADVPLHDRVGGWRPVLVEAGRSAEDGHFAVCGEHVLAGGGSLGLVDIQVADAQDVVLGRPFILRGQVIRSDGKPVQGAIVEVSPSRNGAAVKAWSDRSGAWSAEVAAGCVALSARHRDQYTGLYQPGEPEECRGPRSIELCGQPGDTVVAPPLVFAHCAGVSHGVVRVDGKPAAGLVVSAGEQRDLTDASGHFAFECAHGPVSVDGHDLRRVPDFDGTDRFVELDATPSPWIRGRVTIAGQPVQGAGVRVGDADRLWSPVAATTARDGSYALQVSPGTISIWATGPGGITTAPPHRVIVVPRGARSIRIDLDMGVPTAVQGSVHTADGEAAAGVQLVLFPTPTSPFPLAFIRSDARGFFQLAPAPGQYWLEVLRGTWMLADGREQIPLTVTEGGSLDLDLTVAPFGL